MNDFGDGGHASSIVNSSQNWCFHVFMEVRFLVDFEMDLDVIVRTHFQTNGILVRNNCAPTKRQETSAPERSNGQ